MPSSPTEIVSEVYGAFERGDIPAIVAALGDDIDWRVAENLPHGGDFHGREGVTRFFQLLGETWDGLGLELDALVSGDDRVLAVASLDGRLRATGEETGYRSVHAWTVHDGVPVRFDEYVDAPLSLPAAHALAD
jgi:ketosteroid isomerase-like protein